VININTAIAAEAFSWGKVIVVLLQSPFDLIEQKLKIKKHANEIIIGVNRKVCQLIRGS
jgi:hypothetical protein